MGVFLRQHSYRQYNTALHDTALRGHASFCMRCRYCDALSDISTVAASLSALTALQNLRLDFVSERRGGTSTHSGLGISDVSILGRSLHCLTELEHLHMDFAFCDELEGISALGGALASLGKLRHLHFSFRDCTKVAIRCRTSLVTTCLSDTRCDDRFVVCANSGRR